MEEGVPTRRLSTGEMGMSPESPSGSGTNFSVASHVGFHEDHLESWLSRDFARSHGRGCHSQPNTGACLGSHLLPSSGAGGTYRWLESLVPETYGPGSDRQEVRDCRDLN